MSIYENLFIQAVKHDATTRTSYERKLQEIMKGDAWQIGTANIWCIGTLTRLDLFAAPYYNEILNKHGFKCCVIQSLEAVGRFLASSDPNIWNSLLISAPKPASLPSSSGLVSATASDLLNDSWFLVVERNLSHVPVPATVPASSLPNPLESQTRVQLPVKELNPHPPGSKLNPFSIPTVTRVYHSDTSSGWPAVGSPVPSPMSCLPPFSQGSPQVQIVPTCQPINHPAQPGSGFPGFNWHANAPSTLPSSSGLPSGPGLPSSSGLLSGSRPSTQAGLISSVSSQITPSIPTFNSDKMDIIQAHTH
jgi:hypothetical protein